MKKRLSLMLAVLMLMMVPMQAMASGASGPTQFVDMPNNWSTAAFYEAIENGLIKGYEGRVYPEKNLTRAEMAAIVNRALKVEAETSLAGYMDMTPGTWQYEEMSKAVASKLFKGSEGRLHPNDMITREEAFVVLSRVLDIKSGAQNKMAFYDLGSISDWAREEINGMLNAGYVKGSKGYINPQAPITRAEFVQLMSNVVKTYIDSPGTYESAKSGNVVINAPGVTLKDMTIKGDLIIADGVGEGDVTLDDVEVTGRLLVRAGGENSIIIKGSSTVGSVTVTKLGKAVRIFNDTKREIKDLAIKGESDVIIEGSFDKVDVISNIVKVIFRNAKVKDVKVVGSEGIIEVDKDSEIDEIVVDAPKVVVEGKGAVEKVTVESNGSKSEIKTVNTEITVDRKADDVKGTGNEDLKSGETYINGSSSTKDARPVEEDEDDRNTGGGGGGGGGSTTPERVYHRVHYVVVGTGGAITTTVDSGTDVIKGKDLVFTVVPSEGYQLKELKVNDEVLEIVGNTFTLEILENVDITATFELEPVVPDTTAPELIGVHPSSPAAILEGESFVFAVEASDENLYELEIDHSLEATLPEFSVYADETNPYGTEEDKTEFESFGASVAYLDGVWTIDFGPTITDMLVAEGGITFYLVIKDVEGNAFGSMSPTAPENTFEFVIERATEPTEPETYSLSFDVTPVDAVVEVRDSLDAVVEAVEGVYTVEAGDYSYSVSKEGYVTVEDIVTVGADEVVVVTLEEEVVVGPTAPVATVDVVNTSMLSVSFDQPVFIGDVPLQNVSSVIPKLDLLQLLFADPSLDATVFDETKIVVNGTETELTIEMQNDAINRDLFYALDHPDGGFTGNGDGIYRKDVSIDLSVFNNSEDMASETVFEPFKIKFYVPVENGVAMYEYAITGVFQTQAQRDEEVDPIADVIAPEMVQATGNTELYPGETFVLEVEASDENLYELEIDHSLEATLPEFSVYADEANPYGTEADRTEFESYGASIDYLDGVWTIDFGPTITDMLVAEGGITFYLVVKDWAGNTWGSMSPPTAENTIDFAISRVTPDPDSYVVKDGELVDNAGIYSATFNWGSMYGIGSLDETVSGAYGYYTDGAYLRFNVKDASGSTVPFINVFETLEDGNNTTGGMTLQTNGGNINDMDGSNREKADWGVAGFDGYATNLPGADSLYYGVIQNATYGTKTVGFGAGEERVIDMTLTPRPDLVAGTYTLEVAVMQQGGEMLDSMSYSFVVEEEVVTPETYSLSFDVTPVDAVVEVRDSLDAVVEAVEGVYTVEAGDYSYSVSKEGYVTVEDVVTVGADDVVSVILEEEVVPDTTAPELIAVSPSASVTLLDGETFILEVEAFDENLYELEIDHSLYATLPEFSVYADEANPYGTEADRTEFESYGASIDYLDGVWTIDFGPTITDMFVTEGDITFYFVIKDVAGNAWGSMSPTSPENTFVFTIVRDIP